MLSQAVQHVWFQDGILAFVGKLLLLPFCIIFQLVVFFRKRLYQIVATSYKIKPAVIVVGNISVGGAGKTPVVVYLAQILRNEGYKVAIACKGYKGSYKEPTLVQLSDKVYRVGDEAYMLAKRTSCPVMVAKSRVAACLSLQQQFELDVILHDDGLQHYLLPRDIEIAVVGLRGFGNGNLLPAGPLREKPNRLQQVDYMLTKDKTYPGAYQVNYLACDLLAVGANKVMSLAELVGARVHAVAAIAEPEGFFNLLRQQGIDVVPHVFVDHYYFKEKDLQFAEDLPIIMTEKDAVKCQHIRVANCWYMPVEIKINSDFANSVVNKLQEVLDAKSKVA